MKGFHAAIALLPPMLQCAAEELTAEEKKTCEELRLRLGYPAAAMIRGREYDLVSVPVTEELLRSVMERATRSSLHAAEEEIRRGYVSAPGGVRVGVCGTAVLEGERMTGLRDYTSLSIRVPREIPGCADEVWPWVTAGGFRSLLIVSPPGAGKTTLLRELIRRLSDTGCRVCTADERGELAGMEKGSAGFQIGRHTDVMTGVPKALAAGMMLRSMNPEVLAMDEITDPADGHALLRAVGCGVKLLASVHGRCPEELTDRPGCGELLAAGAFERCVTVEVRNGVRRDAVRELL